MTGVARATAGRVGPASQRVLASTEALALDGSSGSSPGTGLLTTGLFLSLNNTDDLEERLGITGVERETHFVDDRERDPGVETQAAVATSRQGAVNRTHLVPAPCTSEVLPGMVRKTMRITTKGQVTIPQGIRDELGLLPNTEVTFEVVDGEARIRKADPRKGKRLSRGDGVVARLRAARTSNKLTTDEIMALMRGKR